MDKQKKPQNLEWAKEFLKMGTIGFRSTIICFKSSKNCLVPIYRAKKNFIVRTKGCIAVLAVNRIHFP
jgi:hypothetical protein